MRGIIDQVAMDDTGAITILEHKTRRSCSLPKEAQRRTARLQLLMYRFLFKRFGGMLQGARGASTKNVVCAPPRLTAGRVQGHAVCKVDCRLAAMEHVVAGTS